MKQIIVSVLAVIFFTGCSWPFPFKYRKALYCYSGQNTGLDSLLNIQGYYTSDLDSGNAGQSYAPSNFVFFPDGIFIPISDYALEGVKTGTFGSNFNCNGIYKISNDTIKAQCVCDYGGNVFQAYETWFKIIDRNTIVDFYYKRIKPEYANQYQQYPGYRPLTYSGSQKYSRFMYVKNMPTESVSYLKDKKWFRCKEKD